MYLLHRIQQNLEFIYSRKPYPNKVLRQSVEIRTGYTQYLTFVLDTVLPSEETLSRYNLVSIPVIEGFIGYLGYITQKGEELPPLAHEYLDLLRERLGIE